MTISLDTNYPATIDPYSNVETGSERRNPCATSRPTEAATAETSKTEELLQPLVELISVLVQLYLLREERTGESKGTSLPSFSKMAEGVKRTTKRAGKMISKSMKSFLRSGLVSTLFKKSPVAKAATAAGKVFGYFF